MVAVKLLPAPKASCLIPFIPESHGRPDRSASSEGLSRAPTRSLLHTGSIFPFAYLDTFRPIGHQLAGGILPPHDARLSKGIVANRLSPSASLESGGSKARGLIQAKRLTTREPRGSNIGHALSREIADRTDFVYGTGRIRRCHRVYPSSGWQTAGQQYSAFLQHGAQQLHSPAPRSRC